MAPRTLLMLTYHFPPSAASGVFRMLGFARLLPRHGWRTAAVAPPSLPWEPKDEDLLRQVPEDTTIYPVPYLRSRLSRKFAPEAGMLPRMLATALRAAREQKPDAILTSGPPHIVHWLGYAVKRRTGLPWAADFRDPWCRFGALERGASVDLASRAIAWQERVVVGAADAVIANAPGARDMFRASHPTHAEKFVVLPNGYDREKFASLRETAGRTRSAADPIRLVHAGAIYLGRDPRPVLDAVQSLGPGFDVQFFGPPPESGLDLAAEAQARRLAGRVTIAGQVPYARALREMIEADVLLLLDSPGRTVGVPAKLYEYIGARRPILALGEPEGDLAAVLRESGVPHRIAPPGDAAAIAAALAGLAAEVAGPTPRAGDPDRFSREAVAGRLAALLDDCVDRRGSIDVHDASAVEDTACVMEKC